MKGDRMELGIDYGMGTTAMAKTLWVGNWGVVLMLAGKPYAAIMYPVGPQGPMDSPEIVKAGEAWRDDTTDWAFARAVERLKYVTIIQWYSSDGRALGLSEYYPEGS